MNLFRRTFLMALFFTGAQSPFCLSAQSKPLPYFTGFDNPQEKAGWKEYRLGFQSSYSWGATGTLSHDYNVGGNPSETVIDWYVSPPLDCSTGAKLSFKRQAGGFSQPTPDNCEVYFSDSKADPALGTYTLVANISSVSTQYTWHDTLIDLPFITDSGYIAFKYKTVGAAWMTYSIDSIWVKAKPSTVSLAEVNDYRAFQIYPNPFSSIMEVAFSRNIDNADFAIYNLQGQRVYYESGNSGITFEIERKELSAGIYFLEVAVPGLNIQRQKIIIRD